MCRVAPGEDPLTEHSVASKAELEKNQRDQWMQTEHYGDLLREERGLDSWKFPNIPKKNRAWFYKAPLLSNNPPPWVTAHNGTPPSFHAPWQMTVVVSTMGTVYLRMPLALGLVRATCVGQWGEWEACDVLVWWREFGLVTRQERIAANWPIQRLCGTYAIMPREVQPRPADH